MPLRMPTTIQFFRSEIQVAHYSSGLSLLRTSPHDVTHSKGHRPEVACRNACLPLNQYPALSSSIIQILWNILEPTFLLYHFRGLKSLMDFFFYAFCNKRTAKTIQNTSCEEWLWTGSSQHSESGDTRRFGVFTSAEPQEDQLWQLIRPQRSLLLPISQTCPPARIRPANWKLSLETLRKGTENDRTFGIWDKRERKPHCPSASKQIIASFRFRLLAKNHPNTQTH